MPRKKEIKQYLSSLRDGEKFRFIRSTDRMRNPLQTWFTFIEYSRPLRTSETVRFGQFVYLNDLGQKCYSFEDKEVDRYTLFKHGKNNM